MLCCQADPVAATKTKKKPTRSAERLKMIIEQLGAQSGLQHGWRNEVAEVMGIHRSYVTKILSNERASVGRNVVRRVCERLSLSPEYFTGELPKGPDWLEYQDLTMIDRSEHIIFGAGQALVEKGLKAWIEERLNGRARKPITAAEMRMMAAGIQDSPLSRLASQTHNAEDDAAALKLGTALLGLINELLNTQAVGLRPGAAQNETGVDKMSRPREGLRETKAKA